MMSSIFASNVSMKTSKDIVPIEGYEKDDMLLGFGKALKDDPVLITKY